MYINLVLKLHIQEAYINSYRCAKIKTVLSYNHDSCMILVTPFSVKNVRAFITLQDDRLNKFVK